MRCAATAMRWLAPHMFHLHALQNACRLCLRRPVSRFATKSPFTVLWFYYPHKNSGRNPGYSGRGQRSNECRRTPLAYEGGDNSCPASPSNVPQKLPTTVVYRLRGSTTLCSLRHIAGRHEYELVGFPPFQSQKVL